MLIQTIQFEIRNFKNGTAETFVVENTEANYELIAAHRFTRDIQFVNLFDFQFEREQRIPQFIAFGLAVAEAFANNNSIIEMDEIDEMVGNY